VKDALEALENAQEDVRLAHYRVQCAIADLSNIYYREILPERFKLCYEDLTLIVRKLESNFKDLRYLKKKVSEELSSSEE